MFYEVNDILIVSVHVVSLARAIPIELSVKWIIEVDFCG